MMITAFKFMFVRKSSEFGSEFGLTPGQHRPIFPLTLSLFLSLWTILPRGQPEFRPQPTTLSLKTNSFFQLNVWSSLWLILHPTLKESNLQWNLQQIQNSNYSSLGFTFWHCSLPTNHVNLQFQRILCWTKFLLGFSACKSTGKLKHILVFIMY